jgi:hypothetical protein
MKTQLTRLPIRLGLAALLCGCGQSASKPMDKLSRTDPYMQALSERMNYTACKHVSGLHDPAERARDAAVGEFEHEFEGIEASAISAGHRDYIELGQRTFARQVASELWIGCAPNEAEAARKAYSALDRLRHHINGLGQARTP